MKCTKCGADIKAGRLYCSICGQEARMVSDYSLLEDDMLQELLNEEEKSRKKSMKKNTKEVKNAEEVKNAKEMKNVKEKKKRSKKPFLILGIVFIVLLVVLGVVLITMNKQNEASFSYQYEKGESYSKDKDYQKALICYEKALQLDNSSIDVRMQLVSVYLATGNDKEAIKMLSEIISIDKKNQVAYEMLIGLYQDGEDYESILKLKEKILKEAESSRNSTEFDSILALFSEFEVNIPEFNLAPGTYNDFMKVGITAESGDAIYYTLDGSDPKDKGIKYTGFVKIEEQTEVTIRAVAYSEYGFYSEELTGKFVVKFVQPDMPKVEPDQGSFTEPVLISISVPEGSSVYYTWDGSTPSENSAKYTEPLAMPEGNNILSLILIDDHGMKSEILKCNYRYMP